MRGLSLPSRDPAKDGGDSGDWLSRLRGGMMEPDDDTDVEDDYQLEEPLSSEDDIPDWLLEFTEMAGSEETAAPDGEAEAPLPPADIPDWLQEAMGKRDELPPERVSPFVTEDVPDARVSASTPEDGDWLDGIPEDRDDDFLPRPEETAPSDLPEWLRQVATEPLRAGTDFFAEPTELEDDLEPAVEWTEPEPGQEIPPDELPEWLRQVATEPLRAGTDLFAEPTEPVEGDLEPAVEWTEPEPGQEIPPDELPGWLRQVATEPLRAGTDLFAEPTEPVEGDLEPAVEWTEPEPGQEIPPDELPEWMRQVATEPPRVEADPLAEPTEPVEEDLEPAVEWTEPEPVEEAATADMPEWLRELDIEPQPAAVDRPEEAPELDEPGLEPVVEWTEPEPSEDAPEDVGVAEDWALEPGEVPEWLQAAAMAPAVQVSDEVEEELPDWLVGAEAEEPSEPTAGEPAPEIEQPEQEEVLPDWLSELPEGAPLEDVVLEMPPPLTPPSPPATDAITDWLGTAWLGTSEQPDDALRAASTRPLAGTGPLVPPELPDWLDTVSDVSSGEMPDWFTEEEEAPPSTLPEEPAPEIAAEAELPSWLPPEDAGPVEPREAVLTAEPPGALPTPELPDWLRPSPEVVEELEIQPGQIPDWLTPPGARAPSEAPSELIDMPALDGDVIPVDESVLALSPAEELGLVEAEIPDWLRALKPPDVPTAEPARPEPKALEPMESGGPLDGLRGALIAEAIIATPPTTRSLPKFVITEQQQAHSQLLDRIIKAGPAPKPKVDEPHRVSKWIERGVIPLLLLLAILLPMLLGDPLPGLVGESTAAPAVRDAHDLILEQPPSSLVIMAFDYSPTNAGELDTIAIPILEQFIQRRVRLLLVSTTPTGAEIAQGMIDDLLEEHEFTYGVDFLNLGYIPGQAIGLQAFASDPWGVFDGQDYLGPLAAEQGEPSPLAQDYAAADGLGLKLSGASLAVVLTAERDDLMGWVEQVQRSTGIDMIAGVSAGLEPWAQPYYQGADRQIKGIVGGVPGAAQLDSLLGGGAEAAGRATELQSGQVLALAAIALLILVGLVWGTVRGLVDRRRGNG